MLKVFLGNEMISVVNPSFADLVSVVSLFPGNPLLYTRRTH